MRKLEARWEFCRAQFKIRFPQGYVIDAEEPPHLPARIIAKRLTTSLPACTSYLTQGIQAMCKVGSGMPALASSSSTFDASLRQGTLSRAHPRLERPTAHAPAHRLKTPDASTSVQPPTPQQLGASSYTAQSFACEHSMSAALRYPVFAALRQFRLKSAAELYVTAPGVRLALCMIPWRCCDRPPELSWSAPPTNLSDCVVNNVCRPTRLHTASWCIRAKTPKLEDRHWRALV